MDLASRERQEPPEDAEAADVRVTPMAKFGGRSTLAQSRKRARRQAVQNRRTLPVDVIDGLRRLVVGENCVLVTINSFCQHAGRGVAWSKRRCVNRWTLRSRSF